MRSARFKNVLIGLFVAGLVLMASSQLMAQEGPAGGAAPKTGGGIKTAFQTFFSSPDWFGTIVIWGLIGMSVTVVALSIEAMMVNRKTAMMPDDLYAEYERMVSEKRYSEVIERAATDNTAFGQVLNASLIQAPQGFGAMERAIEEYADAVGSKRIRALEYLNVLGAVGPMVGLFGTVYGMIVAFQAMVSSGGQPKPAELAGGVSSALVCTFWGLIVGIPGIVFAALVRNNIDTVMVEIMIRGENLIAKFRPSKKGAAEKPAAPATGAAPATVGAGVGGGPKPRPA
jgi:biopolymer transport protein ExbB